MASAETYVLNPRRKRRRGGRRKRRTAAQRRATAKMIAANRRRRGGRRRKARRRRNPVPVASRSRKRRANPARRRARRAPVRRRAAPRAAAPKRRRYTRRRRRGTARRRNPMRIPKAGTLLKRIIPGGGMFQDLGLFGLGFYANKGVHIVLIRDKPWTSGGWQQVIYDVAGTVSAFLIGTVSGMFMQKKSAQLVNAGALFYTLQRGVAARAGNVGQGTWLNEVLTGTEGLGYFQTDTEGLGYLTAGGDVVDVDSDVLSGLDDYVLEPGVADYVGAGGLDTYEDSFEANFAQ